MRPVDWTLATEAAELVTGPRQSAYAHPRINFGRIAKLWSVVLDTEVTPEQVGLCLVQLKVARELNKPARDNVLDAIGYLLCYDAAREDE